MGFSDIVAESNLSLLKINDPRLFYIMLRDWHLPRAVKEYAFLRLVNLNYVN